MKSLKAVNNTQRELANRIDLNVSVMNRIESNDRPVKDSELNDEAAFQAFVNDPALGVWYKKLPKSSEDELRNLRAIWDMIKNEQKK